MLARRTLLGSAAATPLLWHAAFADTPRDGAVMAMQIDDMISLDPAECFEASGNEVGANVYQRLVEPDPADPAKIVGVLADHWEVGGDGLTYTFHLKVDRLFASGSPVMADDAAWSLGRAATMGKVPAIILAQFGLTKDNATARIKATDDHTLTIQLAEATAPNLLLYSLSANLGSVIEKKLALSHADGGDLGNGWLKSASAGSNGWVLRSWKASDSVMLDAAPGGAAKLKRMVIRHVADPAAQLALLQKGDADIARNLGPDQLRAVKGKPDIQLLSKPLGVLNYIALNQGMPELAHPDVAQAVKWAIDYDAIAQKTAEIGQPHQTFLPSGIAGAMTETPFHKDLDKARALMKQAGLEKGFGVTLDYPSDAPLKEVAEAVQADLGAIGIQVQPLAAEQRAVIAKTRARQHQMAMLSWGSDYGDPNANAQAFCENDDNGDAAKNRTVAWCSKWEDKDLAGRAQDALREADVAKRTAAYAQLQKDFTERAPFVIFQQQIGVAALRKGVSGFELGALAEGTRYTSLAKG